jgi:hypothetical protein
MFEFIINNLQLIKLGMLEEQFDNFSNYEVYFPFFNLDLVLTR